MIHPTKQGHDTLELLKTIEFLTKLDSLRINKVEESQKQKYFN
jgi:hypothetical protein